MGNWSPIGDGYKLADRPGRITGWRFGVDAWDGACEDGKQEAPYRQSTGACRRMARTPHWRAGLAHLTSLAGLGYHLFLKTNGKIQQKMI
jgi:hypothetical protein